MSALFVSYLGVAAHRHQPVYGEGETACLQAHPQYQVQCRACEGFLGMMQDYALWKLLTKMAEVWQYLSHKVCKTSTNSLWQQIICQEHLHVFEPQGHTAHGTKKDLI